MGNAMPGVGSGLDIKTLVNALVNADIAPKKNSLEKQGLAISTNLSALGQIKASLAKLKDSLVNLTTDKIFTLSSSTSDTDHFKVTTHGQGTTGSHQITVNQLAQKHTLTSHVFSNADTSIGNGKIKIEFGSYNADNSSFTPNFDIQTLNLDIEDSHSSLKDIAAKINAQNTQVQASIIQDSQGYRLSINSASTGEKFALKISVTDTNDVYNDSNPLTAFNYDPTQVGRDKMSESIKAKNSKVTIDSIELTGTSNTMKDVIEGLTLELKKEHAASDKTTLTLGNDKVGLTANLKEFIRQYNDSMNFLNTITKTGKDIRERGNMSSDHGMKTIKFKLSSWSTERLDNPDWSIQSLVDLGIKIDAKGQLTLDESKFNKAMDTNFQDVAQFLSMKKANVSSVDEGILPKLERMLKNWIDPAGELDVRTQQQESIMKKLTVEYEAMELRMENLEKRYFKQYNALDALIAKMQGITNNLAMQINNFQRTGQ